MIHVALKGANLCDCGGFREDYGRSDRFFAVFDVVNPSNLELDDPTIFWSRVCVPPETYGEFEGRLNIQAKDRDEVTRKFKLVLQRPG